MQIITESNLIGALRIMKEMEIRPNFSALQRKYEVDRHTIKNRMIKD